MPVLQTGRALLSRDNEFTGANTFNEGGLDKDTRIEGLSEENLLFVDASTDRVGIGTNSPGEKLHVVDTRAAHTSAALWIQQTGATAGTAYGVVIEKTGASQTNVGGSFSATGATNNYGLIVADGDVGIGVAAPLHRVHIQLSDAAGVDEVAVYDSSPTKVAYIDSDGVISAASDAVILGADGPAGTVNSPGSDLHFLANGNRVMRVQFQAVVIDQSDAVLRMGATNRRAGDFLIQDGDETGDPYQLKLDASANTFELFNDTNIDSNATITLGFDASDSIVLNGMVTVVDGGNLILNTTTGTKIGTATTQKLGFWNATPVVQQTHIADAAGGGVVDAEARTAINALLAQVATLGLQAAA